MVSSIARSMVGRPPSGGAKHVLRLDANLGKVDLGGAAAVLGRIGSAGHSRRVGVDEEQSDPVTVAPPAGDPGGHDQRIRAISIGHESLLAVENISGAILFRRQPDVVQIKSGLPFGVGEAEAQIACGDPADEFAALFRGRGMLDERAAGDDRLEIGLERQRLAEFLHHDHRLDRAAAEAAVLLRERRAKQTHVGVFPPKRLAKADRRRLVGFARLEPIPILHQARDIVAQHLLLAAQFEIHDQSPRMALAMMPRWISLEPP